MKLGRPPNPVREQYIREYGLAPRKARRMSDRFIEQLIACQSEEARRLLLGIPNKDNGPE